MSPDDPRHGTRRGYYAHRRDDEEACDACKRGAAAAEARRHLPGASRRLDPTGTARRIQALVALGWTYLDIERETGLQDAEVRRFAMGERAYVYSTTRAKVDDAYRHLCMTLPPTRTTREKQARTKARNIARRYGWAPPLAWDDIDDPDEQPSGIIGTRDDGIDPVVVDRLLAGARIPSTRAEKCEAMRRWLAAGGSEKSLCEMHGWRDGRYVVRGGEAA